MSQTSLVFSNEKLAKTQPRKLNFLYQITGAKTNSAIPAGSGSLTAYDAVTQATIDAYYGSTNEFLAAAFDATAMGANEFAVLLDMKGQCGKILGAKLELWTVSGATLSLSLSAWAVSALTASTVANECAVSSLGNIAVKFTDVTGLDAATDGYIKVSIDWVAK